MVVQMTSEMQWFLVQTKVRQEQRAAENLERQNVASFCPIIRVEKITRGKRAEVQEVLFPGYLFVQLGEFSVSTTAVRSTRGISHFVTSAGAPIKVPHGLVEQLRERVTVHADVVIGLVLVAVHQRDEAIGVGRDHADALHLQALDQHQQR